MKRFIYLLFCVFLLPFRCALAGGQEETGELLYSDILATVNGVPIPSYALNGKTVIALEDLAFYGFSVQYSDAERTLYVNRLFYDKPDPQRALPAFRNQCGAPAGAVYPTDIQAVVNYHPVPAYNIGGKMAAAIEDLGNAAQGINTQTGFSDSKMYYQWEPAVRTITLFTLDSNFEEYRKKFEEKGLALSVNFYKQTVNVSTGDAFSLLLNDGLHQSGADILGDKIITLRCEIDGQSDEVIMGYAFRFPPGHENYNYGAVAYLDTAYMDQVLDKTDSTMTREDIAAFYKNAPWCTVVYKEIVTPERIILHCANTIAHGGPIDYLINIESGQRYVNLLDRLPDRGGYENVQISNDGKTLYFERPNALPNGQARYYQADLDSNIVREQK